MGHNGKVHRLRGSVGHGSAECQQLRDDVARARGGLQYTIEVRPRAVIGIDLIQRLLRIQDHRYQDVVELVRKSAGERADCGETLLMSQMTFQSRTLSLFGQTLPHLGSEL